MKTDFVHYNLHLCCLNIILCFIIFTYLILNIAKNAIMCNFETTYLILFDELLVSLYLINCIFNIQKLGICAYSETDFPKTSWEEKKHYSRKRDN